MGEIVDMKMDVIDNTKSSDIAKKFNISIFNASIQLSNLYRRGFLEHTSVIQESGGREYIYSHSDRWLEY